MWITAQYAADLMNAHLTTVLRQARAGRLHSREAASEMHEGKSRVEIAVESLPAAARERWRSQAQTLKAPAAVPAPLARTDGAEPTGEAAAPAASPSSGLSGAKLAWAQFRYSIIAPLADGTWLRSYDSRAACIASVAATEFTAPNGVAKQYSPSGIERMLRMFRQGGMAALANDTRSDKGEARSLSQPMQDYIAAAYCSGGSGQHPALRSIREVCRLTDEERTRRERLHAGGELMEYVRGGFREFEGWTPEQYLFGPASYGTVRRFCAALPAPLTTLARRGESEFESDHLPYIMRDYSALRPMDWVVFDHRMCDIFTLFRKHGRLVLMRPWETVAIDMRSRAIVGSVMCEVPSALSVASCVREIVLKYGIFQHAYLDNGKEFRAQYIDGGGAREGDAWRQEFETGREFAATRGIFGELGIQVTHAAPYNAKAKIIEPSFRNPAWFERTLAGACGNRPPNRPEWLEDWVREFKRWDPEVQPRNHPFHAYDEFRRLKVHYYANDYGNRVHSGRGMDGRTPNQVMRDEHFEPGHARIPSPRALDLLLQKRQMRKVQHGGTLVCTFGGQEYVYTHTALFGLQGREVETAYDPYQLGEMVCYEPGGDYICVATSQPLYGMGEREISEPIKERRRLAREVKKSLREIHRYATLPTPVERMEWQQAQLAAAAGASTTPQTSLPLPERYERAAAAIAAGGRAELPPASEEEELKFLGT